MFGNVLWERIISGGCSCQMAETPDYRCLYYWLLCSASLPDMCKLLHSSIHPKLAKKYQMQVTWFFFPYWGRFLCCSSTSYLTLNISRFHRFKEVLYKYTLLLVLHSLKHLLALIGSALPPSPHFLQLICHLSKDPSTICRSAIFSYGSHESWTHTSRTSWLHSTAQSNTHSKVWHLLPLTIRHCFETSPMDSGLCGQ